MFLGKALLTLAQSLLLGEQKPVVSGCYEGGKAMGITTSGVHECCELLSDAEESDTRVWMHVFHSAGMKKLLFSPDTDVYHIGLSLDIPAGCDIYVQLSSMSSPELRLLHFNNLLLFPDDRLKTHLHFFALTYMCTYKSEIVCHYCIHYY